jgi:hypothetical protein
VPNSPEPRNNDERLALIQRLWRVLHATKEGSEQYLALTIRIRQEADAFRATLDKKDPTKF